MNYDVIVIGGGMAGFSAAIRCLEQGKKTALINNGRSALHFSSGSVELLATTPDGEDVRTPFEGIATFPTRFPKHPYAKLGRHRVEKSMEWFTGMMKAAGLPLKCQSNQDNHQRITALGSLKSTYLSQPYVEQFGYDEPQQVFERIVILSVEEFRDFQPNVIADNLKRTPVFKDSSIVNLRISMIDETRKYLSTNNFRSMDFIQLLQRESVFNRFADEIAHSTRSNDLVVVPAILGSIPGLEVLRRLKEHTGRTFHEVATMPPSMMGIRLEETLEDRFIKLGGVLLRGDCVTRGEFTLTTQGLKLSRIWTKNLRDYPLSGDAFVMASGSFFSNGLKAELNTIVEPTFGLDLCAIGTRAQWHSERFFAEDSHAFMSYGVEVNDRFQPSIEGQFIDNLYCCGSLLAHYNPVAEGSGGGVAISTAMAVSDEIINRPVIQEPPEASSC